MINRSEKTLKWNINEVQSVNLGFGMHSQMQPRMVYFVQSKMPDGTYLQTNNNLEFSKSNQLVLGYDYLISQRP